MRILVITHLYPPQELGGYGRCIADFVSGLVNRGHYVHVLCANALYLNQENSLATGTEVIERILRLKGSYENGISIIQDYSLCNSIDQQNISVISKRINAHWDGILIGNIDLIGPEIFDMFSKIAIPILHHVGFIAPPYGVSQMPRYSHYNILPASNAVKQSLISSGFPIQD